MQISEIIKYTTAAELTIASDAITITQGNHKLQPESGTSDDLSTINGTSAGQTGILYISDFGTDTITIKHNVGNILCKNGMDITLSYGMVAWYSNGTKIFISGGETGKIDAADEATLRQRMDGGADFDYHFDGSSLPSGYAWASSPFATPTSVNLTSYPSLLYLSNSASARSFLYKSTIPTSTSFLKCFITYVPGSKYGFIGVRYDDGTDNNYVELGLYTLGNTTWKHRIYYRAGGGAESSADGTNDITLPFAITHRTVQYGTKWSNWGINLDVTLAWQTTNLLPIMNKQGVSSRSFTPSRFGIIMRSDDSIICAVDAFGLD